MKTIGSVQRILLIEFLALVVAALAVVVLFETDCLPAGLWVGHSSCEFFCLSLMEPLTVCAIPLALRLFRFKSVSLQLEGSAEALLKWGSWRINVLGVPLLVNLVLYYLFMRVAFFYLAVILCLCLFFIVPTAERCASETKSQLRNNS